MRLSLLVALAILLASLAPTAQAARAQLVLVAPEGAVQAGTVVPVDVTLALSGFMCPEPHVFHVMLAASGTAGVNATWEQDALAFAVPADTYFANGYESTLVANLSVAAVESGQVDLTASLIPEPGTCFAPNGFNAAETTIALRVDAPADTAAPTTNETLPETNATPEDVNETDTNTTNASTQTPDTPVTPQPQTGGPECPPEGSCGLIGEYPQGVEESANPVPATALPLAAAVLAIAALVARRRKT